MALTVHEATGLLRNPTLPLDDRIRAMYTIKHARPTEPDAALDALLGSIGDGKESVLLQHEVLYNLGQFRDPRALPHLERVMNDASYDVVTRHEAIEAVGAIGDAQAVDMLQIAMERNKDCAPIAESCELALDRIALKKKVGDEEFRKLETQNAEFVSIDPAPATTEPGQTSVSDLETVLMDPKARMFDRYRAMFALRNDGSTEAVAALCRALRQDRSSCLFRHEVAFVLGQMEKPASGDALLESLCDEQEHGMVRHESAEALGALAQPHHLKILDKYAEDDNTLVRDSCVVALDMHRYWSKFNKDKKDKEEAQ